MEKTVRRGASWFVLLTKRSGYKIKDNEMGGACRANGGGEILHAGVWAGTKERGHLKDLNEDGWEDVDWISLAQDMTSGRIL
jgi:hypothetical protein